MAAELKQMLGVDAELKSGGVGEFEVFVDDKLVFSKNQSGRFPDLGEVATLIKNK